MYLVSMVTRTLQLLLERFYDDDLQDACKRRTAVSLLGLDQVSLGLATEQRN